jgi:ribose 5-phosphate isomerase B
MTPITEHELHQIVEQVVRRTMGGTPELPAANPQPVTAQPAADAAVPSPGGVKTVAIGADHGGFKMKEMLKAYLVELGYGVSDCGTADSTTAVDYPDFALAVALQVKENKAWRGILVDGAGIGSCMAANKVPGVRAALCYDYATAVNSREHNDANVLTLGAGLIGDNLAKQIVKTWLATDFGGARHQKRVDKITAIETRYSKG